MGQSSIPEGGQIAEQTAPGVSVPSSAKDRKVRDDNRWIVSSYKFHEHKDPTVAQAELERLKAKCPEKKFRLYRVKRVVEVQS